MRLYERPIPNIYIKYNNPISMGWSIIVGLPHKTTSVIVLIVGKVKHTFLKSTYKFLYKKKINVYKHTKKKFK